MSNRFLDEYQKPEENHHRCDNELAIRVILLDSKEKYHVHLYWKKLSFETVFETNTCVYVFQDWMCINESM